MPYYVVIQIEMNLNEFEINLNLRQILNPLYSILPYISWDAIDISFQNHTIGFPMLVFGSLERSGSDFCGAIIENKNHD